MLPFGVVMGWYAWNVLILKFIAPNRMSSAPSSLSANSQCAANINHSDSLKDHLLMQSNRDYKCICETCTCGTFESKKAGIAVHGRTSRVISRPATTTTTASSIRKLRWRNRRAIVIRRGITRRKHWWRDTNRPSWSSRKTKTNSSTNPASKTSA